MQVADSILDLVGNTPLVRLRRLSEAEGLQCTLLAKVAHWVLAVLAILSFTSYWNDFFWPLIVTTQPSMFVINVGLASLIGPYDYQYGIQLSGALLASLPVIIVFLIFQRQFVEGLTQGAFKGA